VNSTKNIPSRSCADDTNIAFNALYFLSVRAFEEPIMYSLMNAAFCSVSSLSHQPKLSEAAFRPLKPLFAAALACKAGR
jgi:hypothetical protein